MAANFRGYLDTLKKKRRADRYFQGNGSPRRGGLGAAI